MRKHPPCVAVGGAEAVLVCEAANELHRLGGGRLLVTTSLGRDIRFRPVQPLRGIAHQHLMKEAVGKVVHHAGRASWVAALLDGGIAAVEAGVAVQAGDLNSQDALRLVTRESVTGAAASFLGLAATAATGVLTGGLSGPASFAIGASVTSAAKKALVNLWGEP